MASYLMARLRSIGHALNGIVVLVKTQPNARLHGVATLAIVALGLRLHFRAWEWVAILLCIGMVWAAEALNTALEFLADEITREQHPGIGKAKDVAAAAVLIASIVALLIGAIILLQHC